jgi:hypothetical protein
MRLRSDPCDPSFAQAETHQGIPVPNRHDRVSLRFLFLVPVWTHALPSDLPTRPAATRPLCRSAMATLAPNVSPCGADRLQTIAQVPDETHAGSIGWSQALSSRMQKVVDFACRHRSQLHVRSPQGKRASRPERRGLVQANPSGHFGPNARSACQIRLSDACSSASDTDTQPSAST